MSNFKLVTLDEVWDEIKRVYDPTFLEELIKIPGADVYAFGGIVTDPPLGKKWKDLDVRVILDEPEQERNEKVSAVAEKYTKIIQKAEFPGGLVLRVKVPGGKDMIIDIGVAPNFDNFRADFKSSSLFLNLKTGEIKELTDSCISDFENGIIRTLDEPYAQLEFEPRIMFRALKFAAKTGFTIDSEMERIMKEKKVWIRKALDETIDHIAKNGKDSMAEYYLGNIFGGLKQDPVTFIGLLEDYGFFEEMCKYFQGKFGYSSISLNAAINSSSFANTTTLDEKLSLLLSSIAKSVSNKPEECFESLKKVFALDTDRSDGNEFVVDSSKIVFIG